MHILIMYKENEQTKNQGRRYLQRQAYALKKTPRYLSNSAHELA